MCVGFIMGISFPMMAAEQNLEGFQDTRWGMTEDQLQEVYQGKLGRWTKVIEGVAGIPTNKHILFGLQHYDIDNCDFILDFYFSENKLKVELALNDLTRIGCPRTIVDILVRKYGSPVIDQPSKDNHMRIWFVGNTMVREIEFFFQGFGPNSTENAACYLL
jgi:hypothetical protein